MLLLVLRIILMAICAVSVIILINRLRKNGNDWTPKTRDYWYGQFMWSIAGVSLTLEGILRNVPWRFSLVIIMAAATVNLIGLRRKGPWGTNNER